ncbi:MAG: hypothetical protein ACKV2V_26685 [Blastocatellia bacterium]
MAADTAMVTVTASDFQIFTSQGTHLVVDGGGYFAPENSAR